MSISFELSSPQAMDIQRRTYHNGLIRPMDGMWLSFADSAEYHRIDIEGQGAGYACIHDDGSLLQFHLETGYVNRASTVFKALIETMNLASAQVATIDPLMLSLCLDNAFKVETHTLLFEYSGPANPSSPLRLRLARKADFENCIAFQAAQTGAPLPWLREYSSGLIDREELYMQVSASKIEALGECRAHADPAYCDLGVIVARGSRGAGLGTAVLRFLVQVAQEQGRSPICSTERSNAPAARAIMKAGFQSRHRIAKVTFQPST